MARVGSLIARGSNGLEIHIPYCEIAAETIVEIRPGDLAVVGFRDRCGDDDVVACACVCARRSGGLGG